MDKEFQQRYVDFSRPFVDSIKNIYKTMLFTEVSPLKPQLKQHNQSTGDYSAVIGMNGKLTKNGIITQFKGSVVLTWPWDTYCKGASAMLGENHASYNQEIADVGMEVTNMVMGGAKKILADQGYEIDMSIPNSFVGTGHVINAIQNAEIVQVPFECNHGKFVLEIHYTEKV